MRYKNKAIYLLINRGNHRDLVFLKKDHYELFQSKIQEFLLRNADLYAYALIPTGYFLLFEVNERGARPSTTLSPRYGGIQSPKDIHVMQLISKDFGKLLSSYTRAVNKEVGRKGSLFKGGSKCIEIIDTQNPNCDWGKLVQYKNWVESKAFELGYESDFNQHPYRSGYTSDWNMLNIKRKTILI